MQCSTDLHIGGDHWIRATTIGTPCKKVVYDSGYTKWDEETLFAYKYISLVAKQHLCLDRCAETSGRKRNAACMPSLMPQVSRLEKTLIRRITVNP